MEHPSERFTYAGRFLVFLAMIAGISGVALYTTDFYASLPDGSYPVLFLVAPGFLAAAIVFGVGAGIYRFFGIAVLKESLEDKRDTDRSEQVEDEGADFTDRSD